MTWILYALYAQPALAQRAFGELLEEGVLSEDLCLTYRMAGSEDLERQRFVHGVDAAQLHLEEIGVARPRVEVEGLLGSESPVGGGISTISANDDVSSVEEMDDAPEIAENLAEPVGERSYGREDAEDAERFAEWGTVDATKPTGPGFRTRHLVHPDREYSLTPLGGVMIGGDGPLATELLSRELGAAGAEPASVVKSSLNAAGVPAADTVDLARHFEEGAAVLAVTEAPGRLPLERLERIVEESGAVWTQAFLLKGG